MPTEYGAIAYSVFSLCSSIEFIYAAECVGSESCWVQERRCRAGSIPHEIAIAAMVVCVERSVDEELVSARDRVSVKGNVAHNCAHGRPALTSM